MTGSFSLADFAGVHTFRYRQSSLTGEVLPCEFAACMQALAKASAFFTPVHAFTGAGAFQRRSPTGGAAKGMPLKMEMPPSTVPLTAPPVTLAWLISASATFVANSAASPATRLRIGTPFVCGAVDLTTVGRR